MPHSLPGRSFASLWPTSKTASNAEANAARTAATAQPQFGQGRSAAAARVAIEELMRVWTGAMLVPAEAKRRRRA